MIILDGRNDREKLNELLAAGEQTHLDYKASLDLTVPKDKLSLVKDIVAMSNRPGGGYLLLGVNDEGKTCLAVGSIDRKRFDGASLGQLVRAYIEGQIHIHHQVHELENGHEVVVLRVEGHTDGLPVPMAKLGQYKDSSTGDTVVAFRPGDVLVREGSANVPLRHSHWPDLLAHRDRTIREEAQRDSQALIALVVEQVKSNANPTLPPLLSDMDETTFASSLETTIEHGSPGRIRQFVEQSKSIAISPQTSEDELVRALDRLTITGSQTLFHERPDDIRAVIDGLFRVYMHFANNSGAVPLVEITTRAYILGGLALRMGQWNIVRDLVHKPVEVPPGNPHVYPSWFRHGQVRGSNANLFPANQGGLLISASRAVVADHPAMRPDIPDQALPAADELSPNDALLNSLCQLDLAYCLAVRAEGKGSGRGYPACAAFNQYRADPLYVAVSSNKSVREELFPESNDQSIASAMAAVHEDASGQSWNYGAWWGDLPLIAREFISTNTA